MSARYYFPAVGLSCVHRVRMDCLASMQLLWTFSISTVFLSLVLLAVITGQNSTFHALSGQIEDELLELDRLEGQQVSQEVVNMSLDRLVVQVSGATEELQAAVARLGSELVEVKSQNDACRAQKVSSFSLFF